MGEQPRLYLPTLQEQAAVWACLAQEQVFWATEPIQAKRLAFAKFLAARRRAGPERPVTVPPSVIEAILWAALFELVETEEAE